jgi:hypothetical protein
VRDVLWLGGMSGVGKTTAARAFASEHDLWLYCFDARSYEHAAKMPSDDLTLDERWVDTTPEELANWFEEYSRQRFPLVLGCGPRSTSSRSRAWKKRGRRSMLASFLRSTSGSHRRIAAKRR